MKWEAEFTNEFEQWYRDLPQSTQDRIIAAVQRQRVRNHGQELP